MKNKLTALLVALLLCFSLLPSQTYAASETVPNNPLVASGREESEAFDNSEESDKTGSPWFFTSQWIAIQSEEGPGLSDNEH